MRTERGGVLKPPRSVRQLKELSELAESVKGFAGRGVLYTVLSAVIFGFTPILTRITYDGGANGVTMTFLRALLSLPVLIIILKFKRIPFALTSKEMTDLFFAGGVGAAVTTILLYMSYSHISVGLATTLHFIYPIAVSLGYVLFFRARMTLSTLSALLLCSVGVALAAGRVETVSVTGIVLALLSGITFAFYVVYTDMTELKYMHFFKLSFYLCLLATLFSGGYGIISGTLTFSLTPKAWFYAFIVSLFASVGGVTLLQIGIRLVGGTAAAILSTFEPITSVVLGVLILHEHISPLKVLGCSCIIMGVIIVALSKIKTSSATKR